MLKYKNYIAEFVILLFLSFICVNTSIANKYLSADITWHIISKDSILVKLVLVRDCRGGAFSDISLNVSCVPTSEIITQINFDIPQPVDITNACPLMGGSRCSNPNSVFPFGFEQYTFNKLLILDNSLSCCNIKFSFESCCRSLDIKTTSVNQSFYTESVVNRCLSEGVEVKFESTSAFVHITNLELIYKQSFVLGDKNKLIDSVKCELVSPKTGANSMFVFDTPYSYTLPLKFKNFPDEKSDFPSGFHVDNSNGNLMFTGIQPITTLISLQFNLYRNGHVVAFVSRDMYVAIMNYPINTLPQLIYDTNFKEVFAGDSLIYNFKTFDADTTNTVTIAYNSALPNALWTTNNGKVKHPDAQLIWVPDKSMVSVLPYNFRITVSDNHCPSHGYVNYDFSVLVKETNNTEEKLFSNEVQFQFIEDKHLLKIITEREAQLIIFSTDGKKIYFQDIKSGKNNIDLNHLKQGVYFLKIYSLLSSTNKMIMVK